MKDNPTIKQAAREFCVLIPLVGMIDADLRARKGDTPLIFQSPNLDGRSNLEIPAEGKEKKNELYEFERQAFRYREDIIKSAVFFGYQGLVTAYCAVGLYSLVKDFF
jgi:hypothetical protein